MILSLHNPRLAQTGEFPVNEHVTNLLEPLHIGEGLHDAGSWLLD